MTICIFSVGAMDGFQSVKMGSYYNMSQRELARDSSDPMRELVNVRVFAEHDPFWGRGKNYVGPVLNNPTWRKLAGEATKAMKCTGLSGEWRSRIPSTVRCSDSTVCSVEKRRLNRTLSSPGMTFGAPVSAAMFETWNVVGWK